MNEYLQYAIDSLREVAKQIESGNLPLSEIAYHARVCAYEAEGMTRSDAQGIVDIERVAA